MEFCNLELHGDVPDEVRSFFFGATLVALHKWSGGMQPIAVVCILRRLIANVPSRMVSDKMAQLLCSRQLVYVTWMETGSEGTGGYMCLYEEQGALNLGQST